MNKIDVNNVADRYNSLETIIDEDDKWHLETKNAISSFIEAASAKIPCFEDLQILNAGSAGYSYGLNEKNILHVDVSAKHLKGFQNSIVANIECMPLSDKKFDLIICVGSVLNYCDPIKVITEFSRVLKDNGYLVIEFESSYTFELLFKKDFNKSAVFVETFFDAHGDKEKIWYFSENFMRSLFKSYKYQILHLSRFHILSPLIYRATKNPTLSSSFISLDSICKRIPILNKFCSNAIFLVQKKT